MFLRVNGWLWRFVFWITWLSATTLFLIPPTRLPPIDIWDKLAHALVFATLTVLLEHAYQNWRNTSARALLLLAYGFIIECLQAFTSLRTFSLLDVLADAVGILVMALILAAWIQMRRTFP